MSRLATLSQGGKTLTYSRLANSDRLDKAEFSPASAAPAVEYSYDTKLRLVSKGCGTREFTDKDEVWHWGTDWYYSYDSNGQLVMGGKGAIHVSGNIIGDVYNFSYDSIGNHLTNDETYNILNQGSGKTYDANGNMTRNGDDWVALYDGENRLRTVSHPYDGVELLYDYAGRIYQVNDFYMDGVDLPTSTLNYRRIYDGTKLIATVRNGELEDTFVWQPETSGDADVILWDNSYVYATDPNKNVRVKRFPNDWIPGTWVEEFIDYKPFGELKNYVQSKPRFMFSSEEYMPETGMYHYLYRAYSPSLARFITRDPIAEAGGVNLYCFVGNNPVSRWDKAGLDIEDNTNRNDPEFKFVSDRFVDLVFDNNLVGNYFNSLEVMQLTNNLVHNCSMPKFNGTNREGRDYDKYDYDIFHSLAFWTSQNGFNITSIANSDTCLCKIAKIIKAIAMKESAMGYRSGFYDRNDKFPLQIGYRSNKKWIDTEDVMQVANKADGAILEKRNYAYERFQNTASPYIRPLSSPLPPYSYTNITGRQSIFYGTMWFLTKLKELSNECSCEDAILKLAIRNYNGNIEKDSKTKQEKRNIYMNQVYDMVKNNELK